MKMTILFAVLINKNTFYYVCPGKSVKQQIYVTKTCFKDINIYILLPINPANISIKAHNDREFNEGAINKI